MFDIQLVVENAPPEYYRFAGEVRVDFVIDPGNRHPGVIADLAPFGFARKGTEALPTACRSYAGCGQILKEGRTFAEHTQTMPPTLPHWDWQAKRGTPAGVVRPPLFRMNWSVKRRHVTILRGAGDAKIVTLRIILAELFAPFLAYPRASSHNAMLARQDMPIAGKILLSAMPWSHPNGG
jgi:hypothetical protein